MLYFFSKNSKMHTISPTACYDMVTNIQLCEYVRPVAWITWVLVDVWIDEDFSIP